MTRFTVQAGDTVAYSVPFALPAPAEGQVKVVDESPQSAQKHDVNAVVD